MILPSKYPRCADCGLKRKSANHDKGESHIRRKQNRKAKPIQVDTAI